LLRLKGNQFVTGIAASIFQPPIFPLHYAQVRLGPNRTTPLFMAAWVLGFREAGQVLIDLVNRDVI
jgi:hypothetical protein